MSPAPRLPRSNAARALTAAMLLFERACGALIPAAHNPLSQAGAAATLCLLLSLISGVLLLIWYVPSVHEAAPSLRALGVSGLGAWVRAAHRWSSDAAMAFLLWHGVRMGVEGRLAGPRWLAWLTGLLLWVGVWFTGWIGFWMAWDTRGLAVALTSARSIDLATPLLGDTLERSLLADATVSSSVFFILFFIHMLLPLALGIILWIHIRRVSRARLMPTRPVTLALGLSIALAALISPLPLEATAALGSLPSPERLDLWYLWPLVLAMRTGEGALVALSALALSALAALPWLTKRFGVSPAPAAAIVSETRCNGCTQCVQDCPFGAISMALATDGSGKLVARVNPALCTSCGVCVGACDPVAIDLPDLPAIAARRALDQKIDELLGEAPAPPVTVVFTCASAASYQAAPGELVVEVPCIGWLHPASLERAMRRGAAGVTLRRCRDHDQPAREGARWLDARLTGARHPSPHHPLAKQGVTQLTAPPGVKSRQIKHGAASTLLATSLTAGALTAGIIALSLVPTGAGTDTRAELVVALRHRAPPIEQCTTLSADELNALAPHMRAPRSCVRRRPVSTLRVWVNDTLTLDAAYEPGGMSADGATTALERLRLPAGTHQVRVALGVGEAQLTRAVTLQLEARSRHALILDDGRGWRLIAGGYDVDHGRTHPGE